MGGRWQLVVGLALLLTGLGGLMLLPSHTPMASQGGMKAMMQRMMGDSLPPGIEPVQLPELESRGASLLARYCSQCHGLPGPGLHTSSEWPAVISRMNARMQMMQGHGMMGGIAAPSAAALRILTEYLQRHAQRPFAASNVALNTPAGHIFQQTCSGCHALPDPSQHAPGEWPQVVARMRVHQQAMGKPVMRDQDQVAIVGLLKRLAGKKP